MCSELLKRLRERAAWINFPHHGEDYPTEDAKLMMDAADAIEELQQTVEHYKGCSDDWYREACDYKAMIPRWIPVTERLPEDGAHALVMRFDYVTNTPFYDLLWFDSGEWWNRHYKGDYAVTHWAPLPAPPKEET